MKNLNTLINSVLNNVLIQEGINNKDYPLYTYCGFHKLHEILTNNSITSRDWENDECICFTRNKRFIVDNTSPKYVRITIDPSKLPISKNLQIKPYTYRKGYRGEAEERIYSKDRTRFTIKNVNQFITQIDILAEYLDKPYFLEKYKEIIQNCQLFHNKIFFITTVEDFKKGNNRYALNINEFTTYINSQIYTKPTSDDQDIDRKNRIFNYINIKYPEDNYYLNQKLAKEQNKKDKQALIDFIDNLSSQEYKELNDYCKKLKDIFHADDNEIFRKCIDIKDIYTIFGNNWDMVKSYHPLLHSVDNYTKTSESINGYYVVKSEEYELYNIINENNELQLPTWCEQIKYDLSSPYIKIKVSGMMNLFNTNNGQLVSPNQWYKIISIFEDYGTFRVKNHQNKYNFIRTDGSVISKVWFDFVDDFEETAQGTQVFCEKDGKEYILFYNGDLYDSQMNKVDV